MIIIMVDIGQLNTLNLILLLIAVGNHQASFYNIRALKINRVDDN